MLCLEWPGQSENQKEPPSIVAHDTKSDSTSSKKVFVHVLHICNRYPENQSAKMWCDVGLLMMLGKMVGFCLFRGRF